MTSGRAGFYSWWMVVVWLGSGAAAVAQPTGVSGVLGVVRDTHGEVVAGVPVRVQEPTTGRQWQAATSPHGTFTFTLPPGRYQISINLDPSEPFTADSSGPLTGKLFEPFRGELVVRPHLVTSLAILLKFHSDEQLTVAGDAGSDRAAISPITTILSRRDIEWLPLPAQGRTVQSFLTLTPGLVFGPQTGTHGEVSALGQRRLMNGLLIDGVSGDLSVDAISPRSVLKKTGSLPARAVTGSTDTLIQFDAIEEVSVTPGALTPEYRRLPGALISIVSRSGTNQFRGGVFSEGQPDAWAANTWWENAGVAPIRRKQFASAGTFLGGPLLRDRLWFHTASDVKAVDRATTATVLVPSLDLREQAGAAAQALLAAVPRPTGAAVSPGVSELTSAFPLRSRVRSVGARVDLTISERLKGFFRGNLGVSMGDGLDADTRLPATLYTSAEATDTKTATFGFTAIRPSIMVESRANLTSHRGWVTNSTAPGTAPLPLDLLLPPDASAPDALVRVIFQNLGAVMETGPAIAHRRTQVQFVHTWIAVLGPHELRAGVDYQRLTSSVTPARDQITYLFASPEEALQDRVRQINLQRTTPTAMHRDVLGAFWQDTIRAGRASITVGVRGGVLPAPVSETVVSSRLVQLDALPELRPGALWKPWLTVAPSIAGTYALRTKEGHATTLRAGWGRSHDGGAVPGASVFAHESASRTIRSSSFPAVPDDLRVLPVDLSSPGDGSPRYAFPRDLRAPRTDMRYLTLEQALGHSQRLDVSYVHAVGRDQLYWSAVGIGRGRPPIFVSTNDGRSRYEGVQIQYTRRLSGRWAAWAAYALSRAADNDSGEEATPHPSPAIVSPDVEWGPADYDQRHNLAVVASYRLPTPRGPALVRAIAADWSIDLGGIVRSGLPVPVGIFVDSESGADYVARPDLAPGVPAWIDDKAASPQGRRLNPEAFVFPAGRQGTLPRNVLRASAVYQIDLGLSKSIHFGNGLKADVRVRAYNLTNRPHPGRPIGDLGDSRFGRTIQSCADDLGTGTLTEGGLIPLQQACGARSIRAEVRLRF